MRAFWKSRVIWGAGVLTRALSSVASGRRRLDASASPLGTAAPQRFRQFAHACSTGNGFGAPQSSAALFALVPVAAIAWIVFGPIDPKLLDQTRFASTTIVDRHGVVLYEPLSPQGGRGSSVSAGDLPPLVAAATLAAEDRRFFHHPGIDPAAVARAAFRNIKNGRVVEGGSTITQQVAKLLRGSSDRSWRNKISETILTIRLERRLSKREILATYLNVAPYGNQIHGVSRASKAYFGVVPRDLTAAQAAFLAALPQRPTAFNPRRDSSAARGRQLAILNAMKLTPDDLRIAANERLQFRNDSDPLIAQHFVERVLPSCGNATVCRTTIDAHLQREIAGIIASHRPVLAKHGAKSVAVAVLDNRTGEWLAWEGSGDYFGEDRGGAIDGVIAPRQPGSTLKPFTYALAFEHGFSPASVVDDVRSHFPTSQEGVVYTPRNYDGRYRGPMLIRSALAGSQNVPAVAMLSRLGTSSLLNLLRGAGFTGLTKTADYYGLGLTLGDAEVRLDQLVIAYAAFARGGVSIRGRRLFSRRTAFWISDILSDAEARAYVFGEGGSLDFPFRVAVKTGTSQAYRDNWTVGYTRDVTVGVWVGNFDLAELRNSSGVTGAAPIFNGVMLAAMRRVRGRLPVGDHEPIVAPDGVELVPICGASGLRPSPWCPMTQSEWLASDAPVEFCSHHRAPIAEPAQKRVAILQVTNPPDGATYLIDPTLRSDFQKLKFAATRPARWFVGETKVREEEWPLRPGRHVVTAVDAQGKRASVTIFVK